MVQYHHFLNLKYHILTFITPLRFIYHAYHQFLISSFLIYSIYSTGSLIYLILNGGTAHLVRH